MTQPQPPGHGASVAGMPVTSPPVAGGVSLSVVAALFIASLALRPQLIGIGPLLPFIREDLGLPGSVAGLMATIPILCMGIFAPLGPRIAARVGPRWALAACLAGVAAFGVLRAVAPVYPMILVATFGLGVAIGVAGAIPSMVVAQRLPSRPALGTGAYAAGLAAGSTIAAALAVPLAFGGDWRVSLLILSLASSVTILAWLLLVPRDHHEVRSTGGRRALPWRSRTAWLLAVIFGLQSVLFYGVVSWLPSAFVERGWTPAAAGSLVALLNAAGLVTVLTVPLVADRFPNRRPILASAAIVAGAALAVLILVPSLAYPTVIVLGLTLNVIFPLVLTLPLDVADNPGSVGSVAALMLLGGYGIASAGPFVLGAARDVTGNFTASLWLLVIVAVVLTAACLRLSPGRLGRGVRRAA